MRTPNREFVSTLVQLIITTQRTHGADPSQTLYAVADLADAQGCTMQDAAERALAACRCSNELWPDWADHMEHITGCIDGREFDRRKAQRDALQQQRQKDAAPLIVRV